MSCCHCSICRRLSGSAFGAYGGVARASFRWLQGADSVTRYEPSAALTKTFCARCGSPLTTSHRREPDSTFLSLGSLDDLSGIDVQYHQFASSRAPWHQIADGPPQHPGWPPD